MQKYRAYQADPTDGESSWFRTNQDFASGGYIRSHGNVTNVCIEDSVAALIMRVGSIVDASEKAGQANVSVSGVNDQAVREHMAGKLTDELIAHLTDESDSIWENNPHWLKHLKPAPG